MTIDPIPVDQRPVTDDGRDGVHRPTSTTKRAPGRRRAATLRTVPPEPIVGSCSGCSERWDGPSTAHCGTCHQTFPDVAGFDEHRAARACRRRNTDAA
ncbi:MAG: hypothetical protein ACQSGP_08905 [Frankia sp.]